MAKHFGVNAYPHNEGQKTVFRSTWKAVVGRGEVTKYKSSYFS